MEKVKNFISSNKQEIFLVFLLGIIFSVFMTFLGRHFGNVIIDCGREAYFPELVLRGKVLYRDIFNIFGPLSYQINAVLYKFFGANLDSLRLAGATNALMIILLLYSILRLFTSKGIAWTVTVFTMVSCVFSPWLFNYIFPYSYAMVYAFSAFLFSVLFLLLYLKSYKQIFMPLSWFFLGVSMANKYEVFFYCLFLALFTIFVVRAKKLDIKYCFYGVIAFFIAPLVSFSVLFCQGLTINEFLAHLHYSEKFALSPRLNYFYAQDVGVYPDKGNLIIAGKAFLRVCLSFLFLFSSIYFSLLSAKNSIGVRKKFIMGLSLIGLAFCCFLYAIFVKPYFSVSFFPIFMTTILCFVGICMLKNKNYSDDLKYFVLIIVALLFSAKTFFFLNLSVYGTYTLPLLFVAFSVFFVEYLPNKFSFIDKEIFKKSFILILLFLSLFLSAILFMTFSKDSLIETKKGNIFNPRFYAKPNEKMIRYIEQKLDKNDSIWVVPEGIMINFLTNHSSNGIYYNLTPPYIDTFGEDKIIADTKLNPPDYIIVNNRITPECGVAFFCVNYGFKICDYIKSFYSPVAFFGRGFKMTLYKKK